MFSGPHLREIDKLTGIQKMVATMEKKIKATQISNGQKR